MRSLRNATILLLVMMASSACRTSNQQTSFVHKNADLGAITKVAVLPFDNLSQERTAGDKVQKIFYLELLSLDVFEVAEPGEVTKVMRSEGSDALGPADYEKLGKDLGVDAVFVGSVVDFAETRSGSTPTPEVTIQLRLIETHSGSTIWSTGRSRSGASFSTRLFGVGGESMTQAARKVVRAELGTLLK